MLRLTVIALTFILAPAALAQAPAGAAQDSQLADCLERSDGTNIAWGLCGGAEVDRQDQRLNRAWTRVVTLLDPASRTDLLAEQRAWLAFRDSSCLYLANGERGRQGQVLEFPACRAAIISDRADYLEAISEDLEGLEQ